MPEKTLGDLRDEWENENPGSRADAALPLAWTDKVQDETGQFPFGFVWGYLSDSIFGNPVPLTDDAKALYEKLPAHLR